MRKCKNVLETGLNNYKNKLDGARIRKKVLLAEIDKEIENIEEFKFGIERLLDAYVKESPNE